MYYMASPCQWVINSPTMAITTGASLDGICSKNGKISSMTNHLSRCSRILPTHTRQFTRTWNRMEWTSKFSFSHKKIMFSLQTHKLVLIYFHIFLHLYLPSPPLYNGTSDISNWTINGNFYVYFSVISLSLLIHQL